MNEAREILLAILSWGMDALVGIYHFIVGALTIAALVLLGLFLYFVLWASWRALTAAHRRLVRDRS